MTSAAGAARDSVLPRRSPLGAALLPGLADSKMERPRVVETAHVKNACFKNAAWRKVERVECAVQTVETLLTLAV